jgi:DNA helicase II / ATP-dependent DNA helicase PcrA
MADLFVGTIHAFCLELVKSESPRHLKFEVLNEVQQGLFVDRNSSKSGLTTSLDLKGVPLKQRYRDTSHYVTALSILREAERDDSQLAGCSLLNGLEDYQELLEQKSYLDYSSILDEAVAFLTNDEAARERLARRVKYVIVDEYQGQSSTGSDH